MNSLLYIYCKVYTIEKTATPRRYYVFKARVIVARKLHIVFKARVIVARKLHIVFKARVIMARKLHID